MVRKKTHEQFVEEIFNEVSDEYTVIGQYINTGEKLLMRHNKCGLEYQVSPNKFLGGRRCIYCSRVEGKRKQTKTHEQFVEEVYEKIGDEFTVIGSYTTSKKKIKFMHNECGRVFEMQPSNFLTGQRCKICSNKRARGEQSHTTEMFIEYVMNVTGDEYTVLGKYINNHTHISMKHNECGYEYEVQPSNFKCGKRCPQCKRGVQRTPQMYREEVYELVGDEYTVLEDFKTTSEGILTRHNECGYEWNTTPPSAFLNGTRCPLCAGNMLKTHEQFVNEVFELVGIEYKVLGKYINSNKKILMQHVTCGDEFLVSPNKFVGSEFTRCPKCMQVQRAENRKKTTDEFKDELRILFGEEYTVLGEYTGSKEDILIRHNVCGSEYYKAPTDILSRRCKRCAALFQRKTNEQFIENIIALTGYEFSPLEPYKGAHEKIRMEHKICGYIWKTTPHKFVSTGRRCPKCNESKGESAIRRFLESNDINFIPQYRIKECKLKKALPFDFGILKNGELLMLIEYDGEQHFKPIKSFGGEKAFSELQIRDKVKDKFCMENNIELLRIPYYRLSEVDNILNEALAHHSLLMDS